MAAILVSTVGVGLAQSSSGHKKTDKLIYRAQQTTSAIRATNLQVKKTLESYNYIVEGKAQDPRAEYKKLVKDIGKCEEVQGRCPSQGRQYAESSGCLLHGLGGEPGGVQQ